MLIEEAEELWKIWEGKARDERSCREEAEAEAVAWRLKAEQQARVLAFRALKHPVFRVSRPQKGPAEKGPRQKSSNGAKTNFNKLKTTPTLHKNGLYGVKVGVRMP